jgi:hypothetical protein
VPALARAIKDAVDNPESVKERSRLLRSRIASLFTLDAMVNGVLGCYEQALNFAPVIGQVVGA